MLYCTFDAKEIVHIYVLAKTYAYFYVFFLMCVYIVVCGYPPLPVNGTAALSKTIRGAEVEYSCFTGQTLKGAQSALCLQDGTWSAPPPTCSSELSPLLTTLFSCDPSVLRSLFVVLIHFFKRIYSLP